MYSIVKQWVVHITNTLWQTKTLSELWKVTEKCIFELSLITTYVQFITVCIKMKKIILKKLLFENSIHTTHENRDVRVILNVP